MVYKSRLGLEEMYVPEDGTIIYIDDESREISYAATSSTGGKTLSILLDSKNATPDKFRLELIRSYKKVEFPKGMKEFNDYDLNFIY